MSASSIVITMTLVPLDCCLTISFIAVGIAWMTGLLVDTLTGTLLGQHALGMSIVAFAALTLYQRMRLFPLWQQSMIVFVLLATHQATNLWVSGITGRAVHTWAYRMPSLTGMLIWPVIFILLRRVRRNFRVG